MSYLPKRSTILEAATAFMLLLVACVAAFFPFFKNSSRLLPAAGDGMKNYFTYLFHIKFDKHLWKFDGMNYPFGENVVFTDNQPILSTLVKIIYNVIPLSDATLIAVHNWTIFAGLAAGMVGFFLCLRLLNIPYWYAIFISVGAMFLQPQMVRMHSHFSMVYPFLPWVFYGWLRILRGASPMRWSVFLGVVSTFAGMIHLYHLLAICMMCLLAIFFDKLWSVKFTDWITGAKMALFQVVIPLAILLSLSNLLYPVPDRPAETWGFFDYTATWQSYFFSYRLPVFRFIDINIWAVQPQKHSEAGNFIGLVAAIFFVILILKFLRRPAEAFRGRFFNDNTSPFLFWIFITSMLLSFGLPFTIPGLEWLLDYAGPYKQFRSIGRLGWISFYAINLMAWPWIFSRLDMLEDKFRGGVFKALTVAVIFSEGLISVPEMSNPPQLLDAFSAAIPDIPVDVRRYQAILPAPYLHVGSECFGWPDQGGNQDQNFIIGYKLGLPNLGVVMSRTPLGQSLMSNELVCPPYKVPDLIKLVRARDTRPLLVLQSKLRQYDNNSNLEHWTRDAPVVFENDHFALKSLELTAFDTIVARFALQPQVQEKAGYDLAFEKVKRDRYWGFEATMVTDTSMAGKANVQFVSECKINTDANPIVDIRQMDSEGREIKTDSYRSNYFYTRIDGHRIHFSVPFDVLPQTSKLLVRISKYAQKEHDSLFFGQGRISLTGNR